MLKNRQKHFKSLSCLSVQKQVAKEHPLPDCKRRSQPQFIAFQSQRKLGKLIVKQQDDLSTKRVSNKELIQRINFRNFSKIYNMVMKFQNKKYSQATRSTGQKNIINHQWKLNQVSKLPQRQQSFSHKKNISDHRLSVHKLSQRSYQKTKEKGQQFQRMNKYLFKKLSQVEQPTDNPQLHQLYANYIKVAEMNENIKRAQLTGKTKCMI